MKKAIKRLIRGDDGVVAVVLIDLETLLPVTNPAGYTILSAGTASEEPDPVANVADPETPSQTQEPSPIKQAGGGGGGALEGRRPTGAFPPAPAAPAAPTAPQRASSPSTFAPRPALQETADKTVTRRGLAPAFADPVREARADQALMRTPTKAPVAPQSPSTVAGIGLMNEWGPKRPNPPDEPILREVSESVRNTLGSGHSIRGVSGQEGNLPQHGSERHKTGLAIDFDIVGPDGKQITDPVEIQKTILDFVKANPEAGVGFGDGYMKDGRVHLDITGAGKQWGAQNTNANMNPVFSKEIDLARQGKNLEVPTPEGRPSFADSTFGGDFLGGADERTQAEEIIHDASALQGSAQRRSARDFANASPAEFAANGLIARSDAQIESIARTLAGELSPQQLEALRAQDPIAQREYANMITTIENRAASRTFKNLDNVLAGSQYNSNLTKNKAVTDENFNLYKDELVSNAKQFYAGALQPDDYNFTNYHANFMTPDWSPRMVSQTITGDHRFGVLGPQQGDYLYTPSDEFKQSRTSFATFGDRAGQNTFGTQQSPGFSRSNIGDNSAIEAYSQRDARGSFGTSASPGVGRSSLNEPSGGGALGGMTHSQERERDTSLGGTSAHSQERERDTSLGGSTSRSSAPSSGGSRSSPTNDGYASSKTPGGGF